MKFGVSMGLLLSSLLLFAGACQPQARRRLDSADELAFRGKHEAAMAEVERALEGLRGEKNERAHDLRREALASGGRLAHLYLREPRTALKYYRTLAQDYPASDEAMIARERMARIHQEDLSDRPGAIAQYQALVATFPDSEDAPRYQFEVASGYFALQNWGQALTEAQTLLDQYPSSGYVDDALLLIGATHQANGKLEDAIATFRKIYTEHATGDLSPRARVEEAHCLAENRQEQQAIAAYVEALKTHPNPQMVQRQIARLKARMRVRQPSGAFGRPRH